LIFVYVYVSYIYTHTHTLTHTDEPKFQIMTVQLVAHPQLMDFYFRSLNMLEVFICYLSSCLSIHFFFFSFLFLLMQLMDFYSRSLIMLEFFIYRLICLFISSFFPLSFAKEPYERDYILQKRPMICSSLFALNKLDVIISLSFSYLSVAFFLSFNFTFSFLYYVAHGF